MMTETAHDSKKEAFEIWALLTAKPKNFNGGNPIFTRRQPSAVVHLAVGVVNKSIRLRLTERDGLHNIKQTGL
jgi:hypothetical protein